MWITKNIIHFLYCLVQAFHTSCVPIVNSNFPHIQCNFIQMKVHLFSHVHIKHVFIFVINTHLYLYKYKHPPNDYYCCFHPSRSLRSVTMKEEEARRRYLALLRRQQQKVHHNHPHTLSTPINTLGGPLCC